LPFDFNAFYKTVADYTTEVKTLLENTRTQTEGETKMLHDSLFSLAYDPTKKWHTPKQHESVPYLNFSPLENALQQLKDAADTFSKTYAAATAFPAAKQKALNEILYKAEQSLIQPAGLPRRPWYKHEIYAPGFYTGYGVKTLPAIREAIEQRSWKEAQAGIDTVAQTLKAYTQQVQHALALLQQAF
jgi:N-acetylated-alpha-linked acidic dipeptidase